MWRRKLKKRKNDYPDIEVEVQPVRVYPFGNAGAQMLGYVGEAGPEDVDKTVDLYASSTLIGRGWFRMAIQSIFRRYKRV